MCEERPKESTGRETNDPVSRCAEVIKSRQIFSLSRRVSDTYIILKGLFRGHYTREKRARSRGSRARAAARRTRFPRRAMSPRKVRARNKPGHFSGSSTPRFVLHAPPRTIARVPRRPLSSPSISWRLTALAAPIEGELSLRALTRLPYMVQSVFPLLESETTCAHRVIPYSESFIVAPTDGGY